MSATMSSTMAHLPLSSSTLRWRSSGLSCLKDSRWESGQEKAHTSANDKHNHRHQHKSLLYSKHQPHLQLRERLGPQQALPSPRRSLVSSICFILKVTWAFVESDYFTFAVPNTLFGIIGALASSKLVEGPAPLFLEVLKRLPIVLLFNSYSLLVFDLANQRTVESVEEDRINKPWRPIPSGMVTSEQTRRAILLAASASLALNHALGIWKEGLLVQTLNWYYNDLRGGDEVVRDAIIAVSYGLANQISLQLAIGRENTISGGGYTWTAIISVIILTTMNIQDLKDQEGDKGRGRKTVPLVFGDRACRYSLAMFVPFWSLVCVYFWQLQYTLVCPMPLVLGALVAWRVLTKRTPKDDSVTWRLWCVWHASLYVLPLLSKA